MIFDFFRFCIHYICKFTTKPILMTLICYFCMHSCTCGSGCCYSRVINPLGANPTEWSNTIKQFVGKSFLFLLYWIYMIVWKHKLLKLQITEIIIRMLSYFQFFFFFFFFLQFPSIRTTLYWFPFATMCSHNVQKENGLIDKWFKIS